MDSFKNYSAILKTNPFFTKLSTKIRNPNFHALWILVFLVFQGSLFAQRKDLVINNGWFSKLETNNNWKPVTIPHNWDDYYGYRRLLHGNLHSTAIYKKELILNENKKGKLFFLYFEGVGSYATVFCNGHLAGTHAGGRSTFTINITPYLNQNASKNEILVKADHPANCMDLPWVCGGCSSDRGFSEGSQPLGIFRPVHLLVTNTVRVEPFGIHAWAALTNDNADLFLESTIKNYGPTAKKIRLLQELTDKKGKSIRLPSLELLLQSGDSITIPQQFHKVDQPVLWSPENPFLYTIKTRVFENNSLLDEVESDFGFRTLNWKNSTNQFILNNRPVFINGIAEYEHLLGQSHAFTDAQINSRIKWIQHAGFNAFRDGHQPHNLLYGKLCDKNGILWWSQFSAHIWYDTKAFRDNFKNLLKEWVIERRNDPSLILWGLQNESKLPKDFAMECNNLIRLLDPTAGTQRLVTTCNGGEGTDWDVPQNWTGTYGGDPASYATDLKKQVLVGEYGAWRSIDLHTEGGFEQNGAFSEDRMTLLMEQKIRLAESVKDSIAGHFFWLFNSHDNPGRVQGGEGQRELDRIGPVNYKGLLTPWEEPTDAFYMYASNYIPATKSPMVYIVSHSWPNRWMQPGFKDSIIVYSNCDEVELFNDMGTASLGRKKRKGIGTHFQWDNANIRYNILYAVGYVKGKQVVKDTLILFHLPTAPHFKQLKAKAKPITKPASGYNYIYRINCGGAATRDENGNEWSSDANYVSSWTNDFKELPLNFASQRRIFTPIKNTNDWELFQNFRYGKDKLSFDFPVADGTYLVELYFIEPWLGIGSNADATGMRLFDVAINDHVIYNNLDIWKSCGSSTVLKKQVQVQSKDGHLKIHFPNSKSGQAIIAAIAIASRDFQKINAPDLIPYLIDLECNHCTVQSWLDIGNRIAADTNIQINSLPPNLFGADWIRQHQLQKTAATEFYTVKELDLFIGIKPNTRLPDWAKDASSTGTNCITTENGGTVYAIYRKRVPEKTSVKITTGNNQIVMMVPVTEMAPAFDLKKVTVYRAENAIAGSGVSKIKFNGRTCATIQTALESQIEWPVQIGVADKYALTLKYYSDKEKPVSGTIQWIGAGNTMMQEEKVNFTFTKEGKWNQFTIHTPGMINAGNYAIRLQITHAAGLLVSGIEIQ
jgi:hypothetical protein